MRCLWIFILLAPPLALTVGGTENLPAQRESLRQQATTDAPPKKPVGDLYFVAIGQQDNWKFLPEGFAKVVRDQGKSLYREIHGRVLVGPGATKKNLMEDLAWM